MKYFFILGRNVELSIAELVCYLEKVGNEILILEKKRNGILVDLKNELDSGIIDFFGGVIAFGKVLCEIGNLGEMEIYAGEKGKFNYVLWDFSENADEVRDFLKKRFRQDKLKAIEKKLTGKINIQKGKSVENLVSNLIEEEYFVFDDCFGKIDERCNYSKIEERDMKKPVRREELAISPRLAKIMINLSKVEKDAKLLDCFSGIGVVLQEALLQGIKVVGIDKDKNAVEDCKKNLEWFNFSKKDYELINSDSRNIKIPFCDVLVSEPDLGETLKKIPSEGKARKILNGFENLMIAVLNNCKKSVKGRFVFTSPYIKISNKKERVSCNCNKILKRTGLKLSKINFVENPIQEFRKDKVVGREIFVLEKN